MYGLLQGLGRGISQGAEMVNRGMAEDREVERQRMREASIEKRWKKQEAKEDKRYDAETKRQSEQDAAAKEQRGLDNKYRDETLGLQKQELNVRLSERRTAEIEKNFEVVERKYQKEFETLERQFQRRIDIAKSKDPTELKPGETVEELYAEYNDRVRGLEKKELADYVPLVKSYGSELKGTRYASYVDIVADSKAAADNASKQFLKDAGVVDPAGEFAATETKTDRARIAEGIKGEGSAAPEQQAQDPKGYGFSSGFDAGYKGVSDWNSSLVDEHAKLDPYHTSPAGHFTNSIGGAFGLAGGLLQQGYQGAKTVASITAQQLFESQAEKDRRLGLQKRSSPPMNPGETQEQYFMRISQKR